MKIKVCILSALLSVLLLFGIPVKAAPYGDIELDIPEQLQEVQLPYYVIFKDDIGYSYIYLSQNKTLLSGSEDDYRLTVNGPFVLYYWSEGKEKWDVDIFGYGDDSTYTKPLSLTIANNYDIYHENGAMVFQKAPIRVSFIGIMKRLEMGAMMRTVVSLIPLLMVLVVSFLAFRKAWAWLLKVLLKV